MKQKKRTALFIVLAVVIVIIAVYFSFFYPPESSKNLTGTMIGVEKSKREIGKQFTVDEIIIENSEINDIIQSADFQNLIKDENFRKVVLGSDFQTIALLMSDFQQFTQLAQDFQEFAQAHNTPDEFKSFIQSDEFKNNFSPEFQKAVLAIPEDKLDAALSQDINNNSFCNSFMNSLMNARISDDNIEALKVVYSNENFGAITLNQNFIKLINASDFQDCCFSN